ncbi:MAG: 16S rRNA (adenine(1518)-N(6)/adenine(1519)-N(6))-dimethyltransferase RsmA [Evtepia sp.]
MELCQLEEIKRLLARHGFHFSKSMGQNFLIENWVPQETAEASGAAMGVGVLEIGPGIGALTKELATRAETVVAVELDQSLVPILGETLADFHNIKFIWGDILKLNLPALCAEQFAGMRPVVCANLPYNITSPAIAAFIDADCFEQITVMIQKEVALRICAEPGSSDYGAFTVFCKYHADSELLYEVPSTCFYPAPKVTSAVIRMKLRKTPLVAVENKEFFFRVVRAAFAQRRKTLLNAISAGLSIPKDEVRQIIIECGLSENIRGERLGIPEFALLAKKLKVVS